MHLSVLLQKSSYQHGFSPKCVFLRLMAAVEELRRRLSGQTPLMKQLNPLPACSTAQRKTGRGKKDFHNNHVIWKNIFDVTASTTDLILHFMLHTICTMKKRSSIEPYLHSKVFSALLEMQTSLFYTRVSALCLTLEQSHRFWKPLTFLSMYFD